jgi:hypothetical protein
MKKLFAVGIAIIIGGLNVAPAHGASTTFYLKLKANSCYSFTKTGANPVSIENDVKALYRVSCKKPHHIQVIKSAQVPSSNALLTQDDMDNYCSAAYRNKFGKPAPTSITKRAVYLRWFFPDAGVEARKYKKKGICLVHKSDSNYSVYSVLRKKL